MIQVYFDIPALAGILSDVAQEQIPYAASRALNDTARGAQDEQKQGMRKRFIIRRPQFLDYSVKIPKMSDKKDPVLRVSVVIDRGRDGQGEVWEKFEEGGTKTPFRGSNLAIPIAARPSRNQIVPAGLRPKALQLSRQGNRVIGNQRTFLLEFAGRRGIFQRTGPGRDAIRLLYWLTPSAPIPASLEFNQTLNPEMLRELFALNFEEWFAEAMRTRK